MATVTGIQGQLLDITVVGCSRLKDTEWISRQDPYVCLEYATTKFRTRTCTDGGKNPVFQEKTVVPLIEGLREITVTVWNSNTLTFDDFIGSGRVQLNKVLSQGYDDSSWPLQSKSGKYAGEVKLIMHYSNNQANAYTQKPNKSVSATPTTSAYSVPPPSYAPPYAAPYATATAPSYPPVDTRAYPMGYPAGYPPVNPSTYPAASAYMPPPPQAYPPHPYPPSAYPPQPYPPPPSAYPPGPFPGAYPPPPY